jgi:hypothetical protein
MVKDFAKRDKRQIAEESQQKLVQSKASDVPPQGFWATGSEQWKTGFGKLVGGGGRQVKCYQYYYLTSYRQRTYIYGTNIYVKVSSTLLVSSYFVY